MKFLTYTLTAAAGVTATRYIPVPFRCVLLSGKCVADYEAGSNTTVVVSNDTTAQISFALDAATTLADVVTGTVNATTIFEAGAAIKIVASEDEHEATGTITIMLVLDEFLSGVSGA